MLLALKLFHVKHFVDSDPPILWWNNPPTKITSQKRREKIMARIPMVTRTITTTKVSVLCLDVQTVEPFNKEVILPRTFKDDKKLFKKVEELVNNDDVKAVHIVAKEEVETLYGMSEQEFIENAKVLDPETRKQIEE